MKISKGLKQAYDLQDFTFSALVALRDSLSQEGKLKVSREDATAIGNLIRAWERPLVAVRTPLKAGLPSAQGGCRVRATPTYP